jgi:MFS family permease
MTRVSSRGIARGLSPEVRRVLLLTSTVVLYETMFFTVLVPLLPHYEKSLGLSGGEVGLLSAAYAAGAFCGAIPGGILALRRGTRTALLLGLALLFAGSVSFGFADGFVALGVSRFVQGIGSTFAWIGALTWLVAVAPRPRRGELIGVALGAAVAGSLIGPTVGAIAERLGTEITFAVAGCLGIAVAFLSFSASPPPRVSEHLSSMKRVRHSRSALAGVGLLLLNALLFGALTVLAPLRLDDFGWSAGEIAAVFLVSSVATMLVTPRIGSWSDAHGRIPPVVAGLVMSAVVSIALAAADWPLVFALLAVVAGVAYSSGWVPGTALLSDGIERVGVGLAVGFVLFNLAWTPGFLVGAAAGGWLGDAVGDASAFLALAAFSSIGLLAAVVGNRGARR